MVDPEATMAAMQHRGKILDRHLPAMEEFEVGPGRKAPEALGVLHERCQPSHKTGQPPTSCTLVTAPVRFLAGGFADGHWFFRST
jgi:hypothetical protein